MNLRLSASLLSAALLVFSFAAVQAEAGRLLSNHEMNLLETCGEKAFGYLPNNVKALLDALDCNEIKDDMHIAPVDVLVKAVQHALRNLDHRKGSLKPADFKEACDLLNEYHRLLKSGDAVINCIDTCATRSPSCALFKNLLVNCSITAGGNLVVNGNAQIGGNLNVAGEIYGSSLVINGPSIFNGTVTGPTGLITAGLAGYIGLFQGTSQTLAATTAADVTFTAIQDGATPLNIGWVVGTPAAITIAVPGIYQVNWSLSGAVTTLGAFTIGLASGPAPYTVGTQTLIAGTTIVSTLAVGPSDLVGSAIIAVTSPNLILSLHVPATNVGVFVTSAGGGANLTVTRIG